MAVLAAARPPEFGLLALQLSARPVALLATTQVAMAAAAGSNTDSKVVCVTGASGYVASQLVAALLAKGCTVSWLAERAPTLAGAAVQGLQQGTAKLSARYWSSHDSPSARHKGGGDLERHALLTLLHFFRAAGPRHRALGCKPGQDRPPQGTPWGR